MSDEPAREEPPSDSLIASTLEIGPTTCRGIKLESQPIAELASDIQMPSVEFFVYGPLPPDEYRLETLDFVPAAKVALVARHLRRRAGGKVARLVRFRRDLFHIFCILKTWLMPDKLAKSMQNRDVWYHERTREGTL